jgi:hypothetical protein
MKALVHNPLPDLELKLFQILGLYSKRDNTLLLEQFVKEIALNKDNIEPVVPAMQNF